MGLRRKFERLSDALGFLERKETFLRAAVVGLGDELLAALERCRAGDDGGAPCGCSLCCHARGLMQTYADGMRALVAEEAALTARWEGGRQGGRHAPD